MAIKNSNGKLQSSKLNNNAKNKGLIEIIQQVT